MESICFAMEENYLKASSDEGLSFYDLKLIKEHLLEQKEIEQDLKNAVVCIPQLTVTFRADVNNKQN